MTRPRHLHAILVSLLTLGFPAHVSAQSDAAEYRIKAAFLFNFAKFVEWPAGTFGDGKQPITFCTIGEDPFRGKLDEVVSGKTIDNHVVQVRHYKQPPDARGCHVLFIGAEQKNQWASTLEHLKHSPVLTVGEINHFTQERGMIGLILEENKLRFDINLDAARSAQLKISSKLLSLAKVVIEGSRAK